MTLPAVALAILGGAAASANDGFYQGAGATLTPVQNTKLRVLREDLEITGLPREQCYQILYQGKTLDGVKDLPSSAVGSIGKPVSCAKGHAEFKAVFHAVARYEVQALEDEKDVQMGFPVSPWEYEFEGADGLVGLQVPGATNFKVAADGKEIRETELKQVEKPGAKEKLPAWVWRASFRKGAKLELNSEYDFGYDISNGFYAGREIPKDQVLWFDHRKVPEAHSDPAGAAVALSAIYYLHPIKLWASPPPEEIRIRFEAPPSVPVTYLVSDTTGLDCVDTHALYFRWNGEYPDGDLRVSYPQPGSIKHLEKFEPIRKKYEFEAWVSLLDAISKSKGRGRSLESLKLSCDLVRQIESTSEKDSLIFAWFEKFDVAKCVEKCL
jgi:hypothetical protein